MLSNAISVKEFDELPVRLARGPSRWEPALDEVHTLVAGEDYGKKADGDTKKLAQARTSARTNVKQKARAKGLEVEFRTEPADEDNAERLHYLLSEAEEDANGSAA